ncbi:MAG: P-loop NTPase [Candidatus Hadarchaeales archaeon]
MILSVVSAKGGVGKTTVTANLGVVLNKRGIRVLLVDADLASGDLTLQLGGKAGPRGLHTLLSSERVSEEEVTKTVSSAFGVPLLPVIPSLRGYLKAKLDLFPPVLSALKDQYDLILVDTPPGVNKNSIVPLTESDRVLLVTTPDPVAVSDVSTSRDVAVLLEKSVMGVVINRLRKGFLFGSKQLKPREVENILKLKEMGIIPEDKAVEESILAKKPVVLYKPRSPASRAFTSLARRVTEELG